MSNSITDIPPPGWYADPSGSGRKRWWNGLAWTSYLEGDVVPQAYIDGPVAQPILPSTTNVNPWPIWVLVLLPFVSILHSLTIDFAAYFRAIYLASQLGSRAPLEPALLVSQLIGVLTYALTVVLAFLDWRALRKRGVVRPFHWAWTFLHPLVYLIGRSVVLRRRVGRGSVPMWAYLLVMLISIVVTTNQVITAFAELLRTVPGAAG